MADQSSPLSIFVDDSDDGFQYDPEFSHESGGATDLSSVSTTLGYYPVGLFLTPWYGTLSGCDAPRSRISYTFNGTEFTAIFLGGKKSAIKSCTIDGLQQDVRETLSGLICTNTSPLSTGPGSHNLTIIFDGATRVQFDGLVYTPAATVFPDSGVDIMYRGNVAGGTRGKLWVNYTTPNAVLSNPGDGLSVQFNGRSLTIYSQVVFSSPNPTSFQYTVDNEPPITITIPSAMANLSTSPKIFDKQLLLATPPIEQGLHEFQVSMINAPNSTSNTNIFSIQGIIAQNLGTSVSKVIDTSPQLLSSNTAPFQQTSIILSSSTPSPSSTDTSIRPQRISGIDHNTIIAIAVSVSISLILLSIIITWARRRGNRLKATPPHVTHMEVISPFIISSNVQLGRSLRWLPLRVLREKGTQYHGDFGSPPRTAKSNLSTSRHQDRSSRVRSAFHQEEEVAESNHDLEEQEEIVNLPPDYNAIRRQSHRVSSTRSSIETAP